MGQRPVIDKSTGIVVNVVEIEDDCMPCTKARHKELAAAEDAEHAAKVAVWEAQMKAHEVALGTARNDLFMAQGVAGALKTNAKDPAKGVTVQHLLAADGDVEAKTKAVQEIEARDLPPRPQVARGKRWFHDEGLELGPPGGNIGDRWDGSKYIVPADKVAGVS